MFFYLLSNKVRLFLLHIHLFLLPDATNTTSPTTRNSTDTHPPFYYNSPFTCFMSCFNVGYKSNNFWSVIYCCLLSHQRHIAYYLATIFGSDTVVAFASSRLGIESRFRLAPQYLLESDCKAGFLIVDGDTYQVVYNHRLGKLFVCGFWILCEYDADLICRISEYISMISRNRALRPPPSGPYLPFPQS